MTPEQRIVELEAKCEYLNRLAQRAYTAIINHHLTLYDHTKILCPICASADGESLLLELNQAAINCSEIHEN